jgi:hypothetical protein
METGREFLLQARFLSDAYEKDIPKNVGHAHSRNESVDACMASIKSGEMINFDDEQNISSTRVAKYA